MSCDSSNANWTCTIDKTGKSIRLNGQQDSNFGTLEQQKTLAPHFGQEGYDNATASTSG